MRSKQPVVIAYVPAWHMGYEKFFRSHNYPLYLLGDPLISIIPRLDRDIRAIKAESMVEVIKSQHLVPAVTTLTKSIIKDIDSPVIMPDETVSHEFADRYLKQKSVTFEQAFLRWDRNISLTEQQTPAGRKVSYDKDDINMMAAAEQEAQKSPDWWRQVGAAVSTMSGELLLAHNSPMPSHDYSINTFGDPRSNFDAGEHIDMSKCIHAEAKLIANAARKGLSLEGSRLYVTTYPCPPCAKSVAEAGFNAVYYRDGYSLLDAEDILSASGVAIVKVMNDSP
jgi:dCMP deaminase